MEKEDVAEIIYIYDDRLLQRYVAPTPDNNWDNGKGMMMTLVTPIMLYYLATSWVQQLVFNLEKNFLHLKICSQINYQSS